MILFFLQVSVKFGLPLSCNLSDVEHCPKIIGNIPFSLFLRIQLLYCILFWNFFPSIYIHLVYFLPHGLSFFRGDQASNWLFGVCKNRLFNISDHLNYIAVVFDLHIFGHVVKCLGELDSMFHCSTLKNFFFKSFYLALKCFLLWHPSHASLALPFNQ